MLITNSVSVCTSYIMLRGHFYRSRLTVAPCLTLITLSLWLAVSGCPSLCLFLTSNGPSVEHVSMLKLPHHPLPFRVLLTTLFEQDKADQRCYEKLCCRAKVIAVILVQTPNPHYDPEHFVIKYAAQLRGAQNCSIKAFTFNKSLSAAQSKCCDH